MIIKAGFRFQTKSDVAPSLVLEGATETNLSQVIVIGREQDGSYYFASSSGDIGATILLLEAFKLELLYRDREEP